MTSQTGKQIIMKHISPNVSRNKSKQGHSISNGPKFQRLGHDPSQILMKLFQMKGIYEI